MKYLLITLCLFVPSLAFASGMVIVDTTIQNVNGGTLDFKTLGLTQLITPVGAYSLNSGTPEFFITPGSYQLVLNPQNGYTETTSGACNGTVADGQTVSCGVDYTDGSSTPSLGGVPSLGIVGTTTPYQATSTQPLPAVATNVSGLTQDQVNAIVGLLRAFGVSETTIDIVETYL